MNGVPKDGPGSYAFWRSEIEASKAWWDRLSKTRQWDRNVQSYLGKTLSSVPADDTVVVPKDYANVEQKKALLFFQVPEVTLTAEQPGLEDAVRVFQAVLNRKLRSDEVNAGALMNEVLFDVLCPAGLGASKIGYIAEQQGERTIPKPMMDPSGQPITDPMTGQPVMTEETVPNVVAERYIWERIPIKRLLIPVDFHGSDFDRAPWLGFSFEMDRASAERQYGLSDEARSSKEDEQRIQADVKAETSKSARVCGYEIWYRAALYHPEIANSDVLAQIIWFEGEAEPSVWRLSPYQRLDPNGRLIAGMKGFPVHILTLRYVSDQAVPPSDVFMSRPLVDEMSEGRSQMVRQRKRTTPMTMYEPSRLTRTAVEKIEAGETQEMIPVNALDPANPPMVEVRRATFPRENFSFNDITERDIHEVWAMGANQQGIQTSSKQTATEASIQQTATQTRMKREQVEVARWFVAGVQKLGALIQLFADDQDYVEVVGPTGLRSLQAWDRTMIQGRFAYSAKPDSTLQMDAAFDKKQAMDQYQFFRQDPLVNPTYLLQATARRLGLDPAQFLAPPQPPKPESMRPSLSVKGEDLNPLMPQYANIHALLTQAGITGLTSPMAAPQMLPQGPTEHGGTQPMAEPLSKHSADETGQLPGAGMAGAVQ